MGEDLKNEESMENGLIFVNTTSRKNEESMWDDSKNEESVEEGLKNEKCMEELFDLIHVNTILMYGRII